MQPDNSRPSSAIVVPPRQSTDFDVSNRGSGQEQAANVARGQIDAIYGGTSADPIPNNTIAVVDAEEAEPATLATDTPIVSTAQPTPTNSATTGNLQYDHQQATAINPYTRTHNEAQHQVQPSAWEKYHSAWQNYYQQYYERYYMSQVHETKKALESQSARKAEAEPSTITQDEALYDLRSKLRQQIQTKATKVRKSRHFLPALAAVSVMIIFLFLQYNRVLFANVAAYVSPGNMDPSTLVVDPSANVNVGPEPKLIIPKITVQVPIIWDAIANDQNSLNAAMDKGVVWFNIPGANARPGEKGNFVLSGHSSNDWMDGGDYKFIFARLEQLTEGDTIYVNYNSKRYTYTITGTQVVKPTDVSALVDNTNKPRITLVTCTPLGTALNRLLVFADQVSPDPNAATTASESSGSAEATKMPSNSPTFLQRIFGGGN